MELSEILDRFLRSNTRIRRQETRDHYYRSVRQFSAWLGHPATTDDLTDEALAGWMLATVDGGLTEVTANQRVKQLRSLWNWAAKKRLVEEFPTVRNLTEPEPMPLAYDMDEVQRLMDACRRVKGWVGPHRARDWWTSLHLFIWDSAERIGAVLAITRDLVDLDKLTVRVPAKLRKGSRLSMSYTIRPETASALQVMLVPLSDSGLVWEHHWRCDSTMYRAYRTIVRDAGLKWDRRQSGFQKLRRTVLTHIEALGGDATAFARHSSRRVTEESYLDQRILAAVKKQVWPAPPKSGKHGFFDWLRRAAGG
jgi:integrase